MPSIPSSDSRSNLNTTCRYPALVTFIGLDGTGSDPSRTITSIALNPGQPSIPLVPGPQAQQSSASAFNTKKPLSIGIKLNRQNSNPPVTPGGSQSRSYGRMGTGAKSRFDEPDQEQVEGGRSGEMGRADDEDNDEGGNDDGGLAGGLTEDELFRKMTAPRGWTATGWEDATGPIQAESSASGSGSGLGTGTRSREIWEIPELTAELPDPGLQVSTPAVPSISCPTPMLKRWYAFPYGRSRTRWILT